MHRYVLDHHLDGEGGRLGLMARLLDSMQRRHLDALGIGSGDRALEVGCANGTISAWMAGRVAPDGGVVGIDLDLSLVTADPAPGLEFRTGDILAGPVEPGDFDLVPRGRFSTTSAPLRRRSRTSSRAWHRAARSC